MQITHTTKANMNEPANEPTNQATGTNERRKIAHLLFSRIFSYLRMRRFGVPSSRWKGRAVSAGVFLSILIGIIFTFIHSV